jgi:hypothetical protein
MRILVSTLMTIRLAVLPASTISAEPSFAVRAEGYVGYTNIELGDFEEDAFQGGGAGSASVVFDQLYLQGDVFGDVMDFDAGKSEIVGGGAHVGWRDAERGSAGIVGTYNDYTHLSSTEVWRAGLEGEIFLDRLTLAADAGYFDQDGDSTGYAVGGLAFYPADRARLHLRGGAFDLEESDPFGLIGAGGEILVVDPLAVFVRWEASILESSIDIQQHSIVVGLSLYWGADAPSLLTYDRAHFKQSCGGFLLAGRSC